MTKKAQKVWRFGLKQMVCFFVHLIFPVVLQRRTRTTDFAQLPPNLNHNDRQTADAKLRSSWVCVDCHKTSVKSLVAFEEADEKSRLWLYHVKFDGQVHRGWTRKKEATPKMTQKVLRFWLENFRVTLAISKTNPPNLNLMNETDGRHWIVTHSSFDHRVCLDQWQPNLMTPPKTHTPPTKKKFTPDPKTETRADFFGGFF